MPEPAYQAQGDAPGWEARGLATSGVRLGRYKLVRYATGETELYDLLRDPLELESLARSRPRLRAALVAVWRQSVDCAGRGCRAELPARFRLGPDRSRALTRAQWGATAEYYDPQ
jgi:hypothetical protein